LNPGRGLLWLLIATGIALTQAHMAFVAMVVLPFLVTLAAAHIDRESGRIARTVVHGAAHLIPEARREEELDEWIDHLESAGEQGLLPLTCALSIALISAPALAVGLRVGRRRRRTR
jgi:hypothetical protein